MDIERDDTLLDLLGIAEGTDKSSLAGDYLRHYARLFSHLRHENFNLIEIGVFHGASVRLWPKFFTAATIVGVDIDPACRGYEGGRVKIEIGSQGDPEFLHRLVTAYPPRIVIDDGSHRSDHMILTFERLFPAVLPGGYYIVEDLHFHLNEREAERLRGGSPVLATDYFIKLAKDRIGSEQYSRTLQGFQAYAVDAIDTVQVIPQAFIIRKKDRQGDGSIDAIRRQVEKSNDWLNWHRFAMLLRSKGRPPAEVADALRNAVALNSNSIVSCLRLSELLEQQGDVGGAVKVLKQGLASSEASAEQRADLSSRIDRLSKQREKAPAR
jgi:hypothetical protein